MATLCRGSYWAKCVDLHTREKKDTEKGGENVRKKQRRERMSEKKRQREKSKKKAVR